MKKMGRGQYPTHFCEICNEWMVQIDTIQLTRYYGHGNKDNGFYKYSLYECETCKRRFRRKIGKVEPDK